MTALNPKPNSNLEAAKKYVLEFIGDNKGTTREVVISSRPASLKYDHVKTAIVELIFENRVWNLRDGTLEVAGKVAQF